MLKTLVIDIGRRLESEEGGEHKKEPRIRDTMYLFTNRVLYLLPSAGTPLQPLWKGQLPLCDVKLPTSFRSPKGLQSERLKIKGLSVYGTFYSINPISYSPSKSP